MGIETLLHQIRPWADVYHWAHSDPVRVAIGPNHVVNPSSAPKPTPLKSTLSPSTPTTMRYVGPFGHQTSVTSPAATKGGDLLLELLNRSFLVLNSTKPNLTTSCWLCYDTALPLPPPYYDGIAVVSNCTKVTDPNQCRWQSNALLTLHTLKLPKLSESLQ